MAQTPQKYFWITPKWPLPAEDGARRATVHLLKSLAGLGAQIHLCAIVPRGESFDVAQATTELGVQSVSIAYRDPSNPRTHLKNLATQPLMPLTVAPYATAAVARQIIAELKRHPDKTLVFDGLHAAGWVGYLSPSQRSTLKMVYRAHNVESALWDQGSRQSKNKLMSLFLDFQYRRMWAFERKICRESKLVAAVSRDDEAGLQKQYGPIHSLNTPIGIPLNPLQAQPSFPTERHLLFIGRLDWRPNKDGLTWFLEKVWPAAAQAAPDLKLTIAGAGDGKWLEQFSGLPRVRILGRVPEVAPLYHEAAAALAPVFFGSGTRVKAIEASAFGRPCISTAIGVEGIGLDERASYFRAETQEEWLNVLQSFSIDEAKKRGERAHALISEEFDPTRIAQRFLDATSRT